MHLNLTPKAIERFWSKVDRSGGPDACWLWTASTIRGYGQIMLNGKQWKAHRASYALAHGDVPSDLFVCHRCDNPSCVNPAHLFLGTAMDNNRDSHQKGRAYLQAGEQHGQAKLTDTQVREVRQRYANGESLGQLATAFSCTKTNIWRIVVGRLRASAGGPTISPTPRRKLTTEQADEILRRFRSGEQVSDLACEFGICKGSVYKIINGKTYQT